MKMSVMSGGFPAARATRWGWSCALGCILIASVARADYSTELGYPSGSATPANPYNLFFPIPGNIQATVKVQVTNIDAISKTVPAGQAATAAQMSAAAVAKANAIAAAINASADAQAKIGGVVEGFEHAGIISDRRAKCEEREEKSGKGSFW